MNSGIMSDYWYIEDREAWMTSTWDKEIYKFDYENNSIDYVSTIPDKEDVMHLYVPLVKHGNYLYCFPDNGKSIWKYNLLSGLWECLYKDSFSKYRAGFDLISVKDNMAILFSKGYGCLIYFDLDKGVIAEKKKIVEEGNTAWGQSVENDNKLYFVNRERMIVYCTDLNTGYTFEYFAPWADRGLSSIAVIGDRVWVSGYKRKIYSWNIANNQFMEVGLPVDFGEYDDYAKVVTDENGIKFPVFLKTVLKGEDLLFVPWRSNQMILVNTKLGGIKSIDCPEEQENQESIRRHYNVKYTELASKFGDDIILCSTKNRRFMRVECSRKTMSRIDNKYTDVFLKRMLTRESVVEGDYISFNHFLDYVKYH